MQVSPHERQMLGLLLIRETFIELLWAFGLQIKQRPLYQLLTFLMNKSVLQDFLLASDILSSGILRHGGSHALTIVPIKGLSNELQRIIRSASEGGTNLSRITCKWMIQCGEYTCYNGPSVPTTLQVTVCQESTNTKNRDAAHYNR